MGWYLRLIEECPAAPVSAPTLLVRSDRWVTEAGEPEGWQASWDSADAVSTMSADHFTMVDDQAETTAKIVEDWLGSVAGEPVPEDSVAGNR